MIKILILSIVLISSLFSQNENQSDLFEQSFGEIVVYAPRDLTIHKMMEIDFVAKNAAEEDARGNKLLYTAAGFISTIYIPVIGGLLVTEMAYHLNGKTNQPEKRKDLIAQYNYNNSELIYYNDVYTQHRRSIQKKENARGARNGNIIGGLMLIAIYTQLQ